MNGVAVVIPCYNLGRTLLEAVDSAIAQTRPPAEIVIVDDGSTDPFTRKVVATLDRPGVRVITTGNDGVASSRAVGIRATAAPYLLMLDADDALASTYIEKTAAVLDADLSLALVTCATADLDDPANVWTPPPFTLLDQLTQNGTHVTTLFRRTVWDALKGFDDRLECLEDVDFWADAIARGFEGTVIDEPLLRYRRRVGSRTERGLRRQTYATTRGVMAEKHRPQLQEIWPAFLREKERFILDQRAHSELLGRRQSALQRQLDKVDTDVRELRNECERRGIRPVEMTDLRRATPISGAWGRERGKPVDRYYIEGFLDTCRSDIKGAVAEVKDGWYATLFGGAQVRSVDAIDIVASNPHATIVADLARPQSFPENAFDCFICTQTLSPIYDVRSAIQSAYRMLRPGGVLLCTVSSVNRVSHEDGGPDRDFWRFTEASLRTMLAEVFPAEHCDIGSFGNVLTCTALLYGLTTDDLTRDELAARDPYFPLIITARAVKPTKAAAGSGAPALRSTARSAPPSAVLMYHRIADVEDDPFGLVMPFAAFTEQVTALAGMCAIVPLDAIVEDVPTDERPRIALTFDDGTSDHLAVAEFLSARGIPATYFVTTDRLDVPHEHYWDSVQWIFADRHSLPESLTCTAGGARRTFATNSRADRRAVITSLGDVLARASQAERERVLTMLSEWAHIELPVRDGYRALMGREVVALSRLPGQTIGCHTVYHLALPLHPLESQINDIVASRFALERLLDMQVRQFAYPYGVSSESTREIVRAAGLALAVEVENREITAEADRLAVPRIDARSEPAAALLARLGRRRD